MGKLIVERMRDNHPRWGPVDDEFNVESTHWTGESVLTTRTYLPYYS